MKDGLAHRWMSRAWAMARRGPGPALSLYAFGKHPAFADFIDVARLPPVPAGFRHFHDVLRPSIERDGGPPGPVLLAWHERGRSAVLWVHPSRDRGDAATGRSRRCPLLLGVTGRCPLPPLLRLAGGRLERLAESALANDAEAMLADIDRAATDWSAMSVEDAADEPTGLAAAVLAAVAGQGNQIAVAAAGRVVTEPVAFSTASPAALAAWLSGAVGNGE